MAGKSCGWNLISILINRRFRTRCHFLCGLWWPLFSVACGWGECWKDVLPGKWKPMAVLDFQTTLMVRPYSPWCHGKLKRGPQRGVKQITTLFGRQAYSNPQKDRTVLPKTVNLFPFFSSFLEVTKVELLNHPISNCWPLPISTSISTCLGGGFCWRDVPFDVPSVISGWSEAKEAMISGRFY